MCYNYFDMALFSLSEYRGKRVCVALSGGADSVCLLHHFYVGAREYGISLSAVTCEHGIRGERSLSDLRFVQALCKEWGISLAVFRKDVPAYAAARKMGLEEAGREFRRACFDEMLASGSIDVLATAHHRDDFAETVLFRLARGTSLAGLKVFSDRYARPLLHVSRAEIMAYVRENGLSFAEDESNGDVAYARNALRHNVLPLLEQAVPGARENLTAFAERAALDDAYLQSLAKNALQGDNEPRMRCDLPDPVFYRAAVLALKRCGIERDYTQPLLDEIKKLCTLQNGRRICLPQGVTAVRERDEIVFCRGEQSACSLPFALGQFDFNGYSVTVKEGACEDGLRCDLDAFPADCEIRTRREGDVIKPYKGGTKSLKKFLTDKKIPAREGRALPVIAKGNTVFAVLGVEISDAVKVTEGTKRQGVLLCRKK